MFSECGRCVNKTDIEENFYLNNETYTYSPCYERYGKYSKEVEEINHKCDTFAKDEVGNYIILFMLVNVLQKKKNMMEQI